MWDVIQYVTGGYSLAAFAIAAFLIFLRARMLHRAKIIQNAPEADRVKMVERLAELYDVETSGLARRQQYEIVIAQIRIRARRDLLIAAVFLVTAVLIATVASFAILYHPTPTPSPVSPVDPTVKPKDSVGSVDLVRHYLVFFDSANAEINEQAQKVLERVTTIAQYLDYKAPINLIGHADRFHSNAESARISQMRAENVARYLISRGVPTEMITVNWFGEGDVRVPTPDGQRETENRRVQITIHPPVERPSTVRIPVH